MITWDLLANGIGRSRKREKKKLNEKIEKIYFRIRTEKQVGQTIENMSQKSVAIMFLPKIFIVFFLLSHYARLNKAQTTQLELIPTQEGTQSFEFSGFMNKQKENRARKMYFFLFLFLF